MSFTFDILDPGPYYLLNNTCGARYGNSHNFYYLLRYFGTLTMMIFSGHIYPLSLTDLLMVSLDMQN